MKRLKRPSSKKLKKERMEFWSERNEVQGFTSDPENKDPGISATVVESQRQLAQDLQRMRLEYLENLHREPDFTDYELGLIAKYC